MKSVAYKFGKLIAQNKIGASLVGAVIVVSIYALAKEPSPLPTPAKPPIAIAAPTLDPLIKICGDEFAGRVQSAKEAMLKKDYDKAYALIGLCSARFEKGSDLHALHMAAVGGVGRRIEKERAEQKRLDDIDKKLTLAGYKKEGVVIGMTAERVIQSKWGRPEKVNRTTTANKVREQWVYGGSNYLYFTDGILTSIQN